MTTRTAHRPDHPAADLGAFCSSCDGEGLIQFEIGAAECPDCEGRGSIPTAA